MTRARQSDRDGQRRTETGWLVRVRRYSLIEREMEFFFCNKYGGRLLNWNDFVDIFGL